MNHSIYDYIKTSIKKEKEKSKITSARVFAI